MQDIPAVHRRRPPSKRTPTTTRRPQRLDRRLSRTEKNELIQAYREGASTAELARHYRASKSAILELLTKHRIPRRYQSMTDTDIDHAEHLYLAGHSLTVCAKLTGFPRQQHQPRPQ
ncbi:hypothetical protein [Nocardia sp.]|uniref:hypothetical protein n=1 Tax=Nocardia sp. TaxID=1821 RepID=UPI0026144F91|nr:hypothetical protein [Nocardia sp.]